MQNSEDKQSDHALEGPLIGRMTDDVVSRGIFLSDLHGLSRRSVSESIWEEVRHHQTEEDCLVLGGDIFDFRWSTQGSFDNSLVAAYAWLQELLDRSGKAKVTFLPGNHDCHPRFLRILDELQEQESRFSWHEYALLLGDCLFLHGDILDAGESVEDLHSYRQQFHHERPKPEYMHRCYDMVVWTRAHRWIPRLRYPPERTCARLLRRLNQLQLYASPASRIYFGHTHNPIHNHVHQGVTFCNPGGALRHANFVPHRFSLNS